VLEVASTVPSEPGEASIDGHGRAHAWALALVGVLTAVVLLLTASGQIYDANHYALTEATAILAGDHPYVDFFEVGVPLAAYSAAAAQVLSGHRLLGEFLRQWAFIVAGVVLAFHLGMRLSRRVDLTLTTLPVTLLVLANTPTYHYSKLFFLPLATVVAWRYIDRPGVLNAVLMALTAAIAFLFRHDYGVYIGFASIVAFVLARASVPASRTRRAMGIEAGAYAACVLIVLAPWAGMVRGYEGLRA
jgi:hypothetical protein